MKTLLIGKLHSYMVQHHTDLLIALQEDHRLSHYLGSKVDSISGLIQQLQQENRPGYVIEALCLEELTRDLRPSRFSWMRELLEDEFPQVHRQMQRSGILTYELINMSGACEPIFEVFGFGEEHEDLPALRAAITGMIAEYLENQNPSN
ncbi:hypothetical protein FPZ42_07215 [Mucilaginibacter achroorhodeus]|uniref:Uncharacterized protein n=1 Tax=Mucilaginibacter achroorhodeus TaxID=2599294 RepID=A0A563U640_9SPHI|nr:hypothetical protein [Mucilaginibacter achroorhodeus]TWR26820.1 hypothetical protein FPZ42_07215 [Mucilaginibacter achroorhodeus]